MPHRPIGSIGAYSSLASETAISRIGFPVTINDLSTADNQQTLPRPGAIPQAPPDEPASVTIALTADRVVAGTPVAITVGTDRGTHWVWIPQDLSFDSRPIVTYTGEVRISVNGVQVAGGGSVTFPRPGVHSVVAAAVTTGGTVISSRPLSVRVAAAAPPAFTVTAPADGSAIGLNEGGGQVTVTLTMSSDQYFPLSVGIAWDGRTTTERFTGTQYQKTIMLAPMPLGPRTISITCADPDGLASTQTRTLTGTDAAPPHLQVSYPQPSANIVGDATGAVTVADARHGRRQPERDGGRQCHGGLGADPRRTPDPAHPGDGRRFQQLDRARCRWSASARTPSTCGRPTRPATRCPPR